MKPDKHKKEKNAAYKKKHGISDTVRQDKKSEQATCSTPDGARDGGVGKAAPAAGAGWHRKLKEEPGETQRNASTSACLKADSELHDAKSYSRRKVVSNWERYEVEENEVQTLRGSDFAELLKSSASVRSHFQYRDDLGLMDEDIIKPSSIAKFLALDCDDLALSLMCIPLNERLAIDDSAFEPKLLQHFKEKSAENASSYEKSHVEGTCETASLTLSENKTTTEENVLVAEVEMTDKSSLKLSNLVDDESPCEILENSNKEPEKQLQNNSEEPENRHESNSVLVPDTQASQLETSLKCSKYLGNNLVESEVAGKADQPQLNEITETERIQVASKTTFAEKVETGKATVSQAKPTLKELENELDLLLSL